MKIKIDLKIFIFLFIFFLTKQIKIYSFLMLFAFLHELGHLFAGLILQFKLDSFKIAPYGFSINFNVNYDDYNLKFKNANKITIKKLIISLAGPLMNLFLIIITWIYSLITKQNQVLNIPIELIIYSNLLIMIFNLIPIYPLDGGRIIKEITYLFNGLTNSYKITNRVSNITIIFLSFASSILLLFYNNIAIIFILAYLWAINIKRNHLFEIKMKMINK